MKPSKATCPHGTPWFVDCWPCADEEVADQLRNPVIAEIGPGYVKRNYTARLWPRGCAPKFRPTKFVQISADFEDDNFFGPFDPNATTSCTYSGEPIEPLSRSSWLQALASFYRKWHGSHLRTVK